MTPDAIRTLPEGELRGWCLAVFAWGIQPERDGERAEVIKRAKVLKIPLDSLPMAPRNAMNNAGREGFADPLPPLDDNPNAGGSSHAR